MAEGVKKNEVGAFEVFHGGEMIARVKGEAEGWHIYNEACARTMGTMHQYKEFVDNVRYGSKEDL